jgi:L-asparagine oxygenase
MACGKADILRSSRNQLSAAGYGACGTWPKQPQTRNVPSTLEVVMHEPAECRANGGKTAAGHHDDSYPRTSEVDPSLSCAEIARWRRAARECVACDLVGDAEGFVAAAQRNIQALPERLVACLRGFRRYGSPTGGLLIHGLPTFDVPPTPPDPGLAVGTRVTAAGLLGTVSAIIGDQYGFRPELDGHIIQDIVPVHGFEETQQSISSGIELYTHIELAFTEDRPDWLALFCLRADHEKVAGTTLSAIDTMLPLLSADTIRTLRQPRFKTTVDASFLRGMGRGDPIYISPIRVFTGSTDRPRMRADFAETTGNDRYAQEALDELRRAAEKTAVVICLEPGDLLLIDNHHAFHGRTPFRARWDGRDRWLLRTSIARDLSRSAAHRPGDGRIIDVDYSSQVLAAMCQEDISR